jgi:DNA modification methylase
VHSNADVATSHTLHLGDARELEWIPDGSVHLVVTSPPYWTLKKYHDHTGQLGAVEDYGKPYEPNAIIKNDLEYLLMLRKPGGYRKPTEQQRLLSKLSKEEHAKWFRSFWADIPGTSTRDHPAPFPVELAYRLIRMFSFVGDTVLDPFAGTCSTIVAAIKATRNSIANELDPEYFRLGMARVKREAYNVADLFDKSPQLEVI